ncbi:MAG: ABC transporter substrate-binding protein [Candidatus Edwardsbacteria bacterium]|jgi:peptide/nickel transport system substrate-binding protein|nr:ABC transporter substrate-binding protein [Candidatus Edwardsbacteria bacterium]
MTTIRPARTIPGARTATLWRIVALMLAVSGCARQRPQTVGIVFDGRPLTLDPNAHREIVTRSVLSNCFEGLVGFDPEMRITPLLAGRWENPDDVTWVFHLRPGVRFHNGRPLDAAAVVGSFRLVSGPAVSQPGGRLEDIDTVYAADSATVVVRTVRPNAVLLNRLTKLYIVSGRPPRAVARDTGAVAMLAGTGPYTIDSWRGDRMALTRWPGYWGPAPAAAGLRLLFREGHRGTAELLRRGDADIAAGINTRDAGRIERLGGVRLLRRPGLAVRYLRADPAVKPYSDPAVRRAISLALDRQQLVDSTAAGYGRPASQMVTAAVFGFNPALPPLGCDPDSARALLAAAGYRGGPALLLDVIGTRRDLGALIQRQLRRAGFACSLAVHGREEFFRGTGRPSHFFLSAVASNSGDASGALALGRAGGGEAATSGIMDPGRRLEALQEAMAAFTARLEFIPLFSEDDLSAVSDRVDWHPRQDLMVLGKEVTISRRDTDVLR